jgi:YidC/Oxa1 family membrane protein insertase
MTPIAYRQQKSMFKMQAMQPQLKKIQDRYKDAMSDPELQRKMNMEIQKVYSDNDYNALAGCLPLLIQLPIFYGLYRVMQNPYAFIDGIGDIYNQISTIVLNTAGSNSKVLDLVSQFSTLGGLSNGDTVNTELFNRILNILSPEQVKQLMEAVGSSDLNTLYSSKVAIESFLGLDLTETVGLSLSVKLIIPVLSGLTTFLTSWLMQRKNKPTDAAMIQQQRIMNIVMPLMMAWITTSLPGGIGIYWITSNLFQVIQQVVLNRHFEKHPELVKVVESKLPKTEKKSR